MEILAELSTATGWSVETLFITLTGATAFLLAFTVIGLVMGLNSPIRRRLSATVGAAGSAGGAPSKKQRDYTAMIEPFADYVLPQDGEERARVQDQLIHAGFRSRKALPYFYGIKTLLAIGLPLAVFVASRWIPDWTLNTLIFAMVLAAMIGVAAPNFVLEKIRINRVRKLRNGFPDALDLLVVCVEAGLGLGSAIDRVARDLDVSHPELAEELNLVNVEIRAGVERPVALKNLAARTGVEDIRGLVALLVQTMRFGTSVADALRVYSEEFRDKRMQKAEEAAAKIGTKLIFPLVFCLFPSFFIVAIGPAVLRLMLVFRTL